MNQRLNKEDDDDQADDPDPTLDQSSNDDSSTSEYLPHYHPASAASNESHSDTSQSVPHHHSDGTMIINSSQSPTETANNVDKNLILVAIFKASSYSKWYQKQPGDFIATHSSAMESINNREAQTESSLNLTMNQTNSQNSQTNPAREGVAQEQRSKDDHVQEEVENAGAVYQAMLLPSLSGKDNQESQPEGNFECGDSFIASESLARSNPSIALETQAPSTKIQIPTNFEGGQFTMTETSTTRSALLISQEGRFSASMTLFNKSAICNSCDGFSLHLKSCSRKMVQYDIFQHSTVLLSTMECQVLIRLNNPQSCCVGLQAEKPEPPPVLVMDYFPTSLESLINRAAISSDANRYAVLTDVALGLNYLHNGSTRIVHGDLSAKKVMISTCTLQARIVDFNIDCHFSSMGHTLYREPTESLAVEANSTHDASADIFSFGVLTIQMFIEQPHLNGRAAASEWLQNRQFLEDIGYFHPLLNRLIHSCITDDPRGTGKAMNIVDQITYIAQWFPVSSTHKERWISVLQAPIEPQQDSPTLTSYDNEECSSANESYQSTTAEVNSINPASPYHVNEKVGPCISESKILKALKLNKAGLFTLSLSSSSDSVQMYMLALLTASTMPPQYVTCTCTLPYAFLKQIHIYGNSRAEIVEVATHLFPAIDTVHQMSKYVEVSGFLNLPHSGECRSLMYIVTGDNLVECLALETTACISTESPTTCSQAYNKRLDKATRTCDQILPSYFFQHPFRQPTLISFDVNTVKKFLHFFTIPTQIMISELLFKYKWPKQVTYSTVSNEVQESCPFNSGKLVHTALQKKDGSTSSVCQSHDTLHVRDRPRCSLLKLAVKKKHPKGILTCFEADKMMSRIHLNTKRSPSVGTQTTCSQPCNKVLDRPSVAQLLHGHFLSHQLGFYQLAALVTVGTTTTLVLSSYLSLCTMQEIISNLQTHGEGMISEPTLLKWPKQAPYSVPKQVQTLHPFIITQPIYLALTQKDGSTVSTLHKIEHSNMATLQKKDGFTLSTLLKDYLILPKTGGFSFSVCSSHDTQNAIEKPRRSLLLKLYVNKKHCRSSIASHEAAKLKSDRKNDTLLVREKPNFSPWKPKPAVMKEDSTSTLAGFKIAKISSELVAILYCTCPTYFQEMHSSDDRSMYTGTHSQKSEVIQAIIQFFPLVVTVHQLRSCVEVSGFFNLPTNLSHSGERRSLVYNQVECLALERKAHMNTLTMCNHEMLDRSSFDQLLLSHFEAHQNSRKPVLPALTMVDVCDGSITSICSSHDTQHAREKLSCSLLKPAAKERDLESSLGSFETARMKPDRKKRCSSLSVSSSYTTKPLQVKKKPTIKGSLCKLAVKKKVSTSPSVFKTAKTNPYPVTSVNMYQYMYSFRWPHIHMYLHIHISEYNNPSPGKESLINSMIVTRKRDFNCLKLYVWIGLENEVNPLAMSIPLESRAVSTDYMRSSILKLIHNVCFIHLPSESYSLFYELKRYEETSGVNTFQLNQKLHRYKALVQFQGSKHVHFTTKVQLHGDQTTVVSKYGHTFICRRSGICSQSTKDTKSFTSAVSVKRNVNGCSNNDSSKDNDENRNRVTDRKSGDKNKEDGGCDSEDEQSSDGEERDGNKDKGGGGYFGDGEDSDNEKREGEGGDKKHNGRKKRKKKKKRATTKIKSNIRYVDRPISLVRGPDDELPRNKTDTQQSQQETNHSPPSTMQVVDGAKVHYRNLPMQGYGRRVYQPSVGANCISQHVLPLQNRQILGFQALQRRIISSIGDPSVQNRQSLSFRAQQGRPNSYPDIQNRQPLGFRAQQGNPNSSAGDPSVQNCQPLGSRAQQGHPTSPAGDPNIQNRDPTSSSMLSNQCVPMEETCHQSISATAHGSVLVQPQVVPVSNATTLEAQMEETHSVAQPLASISSASAIDSGLGASNLTSSRQQSHPPVQNNHHHCDRTPVIPARQRRPVNSSSNEPYWNSATPHVGVPITNGHYDAIHDNQQQLVMTNETQNEQHDEQYAHNEVHLSNHKGTDGNYDNTRGYENAETEEGERLPTYTALIAMPHSSTYQVTPQIQVVAESPQQSSTSASPSNGAHVSAHDHGAHSSPPVPLPRVHMNSAISSFVELVEPSIDTLVHLNEARPLPAPRRAPQATNAYRPHPGQTPTSALPHPQGLMMFGALQQPQEEPLVGVHGHVVNNAAPQQNIAHTHIPAVINASIHQPGNGVPFHALVEDTQPRELFHL